MTVPGKATPGQPSLVFSGTDLLQYQLPAAHNHIHCESMPTRNRTFDCNLSRPQTINLYDEVGQLADYRRSRRYSCLV